MPFKSPPSWQMTPDPPITPYPWGLQQKPGSWNSPESLEIKGAVIAEDTTVATIRGPLTATKQRTARLMVGAPFLAEAASNLLSKRQKGTVDEEDYLMLEWAYRWAMWQTDDSYEKVLEKYRAAQSAKPNP